MLILGSETLDIFPLYTVGYWENKIIQYSCNTAIALFSTELQISFPYKTDCYAEFPTAPFKVKLMKLNAD